MTGRPQQATTSVLVMSHGTPRTRDEIEAFYTRIRGGRPPTAEQLDDLRRRYDLIGGKSPLATITAAQIEGLAKLLEAEQPGGFEVELGTKHSTPTIEDSALKLAASRPPQVVGLVLTPHRSASGSEEDLARAARGICELENPADFVPVPQWYEVPGFAELIGNRVREAPDSLPSTVADRPHVLFTAQSVPQPPPGSDDPYRRQVNQSAEMAAEAAGLLRSGTQWRVAWQSARKGASQWIGAQLENVLADLAADGASAVVACPIGFVSDHLEVLYDLDIEARGLAENAGLYFARTRSLNDDPAFLDVLALAVRRAVGRITSG